MENLCRVCMSPGSHGLFTHSNGNKTPVLSSTTGKPEASVPDRLLEKLRYVSMVQIYERTNEPKMLCDICIVQLNVAYNFKRRANRTEADMHQYLIEMGLPAIRAAPIVPAAVTAPIPTAPMPFPTPQCSQINDNGLLHRRLDDTHPVSVAVPGAPNVLAGIAIKVESLDNDDVIAIALQTDTKHQHQHPNQSPALPTDFMVNIPAAIGSPRISHQSMSGDSATSSTDIEFMNSYLSSSKPAAASAFPKTHRNPMHKERTSTGFIVADAKKRTKIRGRRQSNRELKNLAISLLESNVRPTSRLREDRKN